MEEKKDKGKFSKRKVVIRILAGVCLAGIVAVAVRFGVYKPAEPAEVPGILLKDRSWDEWEWDGRTLWKKEQTDAEGNVTRYDLYDYRKGHDVTEFNMDREAEWASWMDLEPGDAYVTASEEGYEQKMERYSLSPQGKWDNSDHIVTGYDENGKKCMSIPWNQMELFF